MTESLFDGLTSQYSIVGLLHGQFSTIYVHGGNILLYEQKQSYNP
jgi:hypothetical protein